jgi:hypothetical protein
MVLVLIPLDVASSLSDLFRGQYFAHPCSCNNGHKVMAQFSQVHVWLNITQMEILSSVYYYFTKVHYVYFRAQLKSLAIKDSTSLQRLSLNIYSSDNQSHFLTCGGCYVLYIYIVPLKRLIKSVPLLV